MRPGLFPGLVRFSEDARGRPHQPSYPAPLYTLGDLEKRKEVWIEEKDDFLSFCLELDNRLVAHIQSERNYIGRKSTPEQGLEHTMVIAQLKARAEEESNWIDPATELPKDGELVEVNNSSYSSASEDFLKPCGLHS